MKQIVEKQTKKAGRALTAAVAFAIFGSAAMAAPPADGPAFASADISIERRGEDQDRLLRHTGGKCPKANRIIRGGGERSGRKTNRGNPGTTSS